MGPQLHAAAGAGAEGDRGVVAGFFAPAAPTRPIPYLGAAPPDPRYRPERPRPQTPDGLKVSPSGV
ncbi:hypothetical protein FGD71_006125 [Streptomyces sporangiiformans]|uniref:Uncharacterized protein n=1 Tax=Streptomyces sporangiiformans TaxID=2315329 RepID=A0A505DPA6_9ACTN|nr:hypothetical protein FGD71_006125 [Streptomyces sporangiiformans]